MYRSLLYHARAPSQHAYLRLRHVTGITPQVEEGLAQLMACLWLDQEHMKLKVRRFGRGGKGGRGINCYSPTVTTWWVGCFERRA